MSAAYNSGYATTASTTGSAMRNLRRSLQAEVICAAVLLASVRAPVQADAGHATVQAMLDTVHAESQSADVLRNCMPAGVAIGQAHGRLRQLRQTIYPTARQVAEVLFALMLDAQPQSARRREECLQARRLHARRWRWLHRGEGRGRPLGDAASATRTPSINTNSCSDPAPRTLTLVTPPIGPLRAMVTPGARRRTRVKSAPWIASISA